MKTRYVGIFSLIVTALLVNVLLGFQILSSTVLLCNDESISTSGDHRSPAQNEAQGWSPDFMLSDPILSIGREPSVAMAGPAIHVVWEDWRLVSEGRAPEVFYRRSTDNGLTWSEEMMLSDDDLEFSGHPAIAVEGANIFVLWNDGRGYASFELYYANSSDGGRTWSENVLLTPDDGFCSEGSLIVVDSGVIHITWADEREGQYEVYYKKSTDLGVSWSNDTRLTYWTLGTDGPSGIDANQSRVHILSSRYMGNWEAFYIRSEDNGSTWSSPVPLVDLDGWNSWGCEIVASGSGVHVGFLDSKGGLENVYYRNSTDNGSTWNQEVRISDSTNADQCDVSVASSTVHVVWTDPKPGNREIYYRNSTDSGVSWGEETRLTHYEGSSVVPGILANVTQVHVVWIDKRHEDPKIFYKRHPDFGPDAIPPKAPALLSASLTNSSRDVQLSWSPSSDEGSVGGTTQYQILRSDEIEGPYVVLARMNVSASPSYVWADLGAGEGDPNDYFYCVCAVDLGNNTACAENQAGKFTRPLSMGPNLMSIPLIQMNESVESVLQTARYDKAWSYDSASGKWKKYSPFRYTNDLDEINHTIGFWVNVARESNLTIAGLVPTLTRINLNEGWNLVGFPSFNSTYTISYLKTSAGVTRVEVFDSTSVPYHLRIPLDTEPMQSGYGYWIKAETETTWTVESS